MTWRDRKLIKVISGVRRCGKSTLLDIFEHQLLEDGVRPESIIRINFEDLAWEQLLDYRELHRYIASHLSDGGMTYVLLDEVQHVPQFELAVDSLFLRDNVDIYLTGSNGYFMSTELTTLLTGRFVEIDMLPLSFSEFCAGHRIDAGNYPSVSDAYRRFITESAFPFTLKLADEPQARRDYLQAIYDSILYKDVATRNRIADAMMLDDVTRYLFDNIGNITSTTRIANTLTSAGRSVNQRTVEKYITALSQSLLFYEARRYDIRGKRLLTRLEKYYCVDLGLRYTISGGRGFDVGHVLENVIFLELLRRGYDVFVGQYDRQEVDFIAVQTGERLYVQVAATTRDPDVLSREVGPLRAINDSYPKLILTLDDDPAGNYDGLRRMNALTWLLQA